METETKTVQTLATKALKHFETRKRVDGKEFVCTTDDRPDWVQELCRVAHDYGDLMPDDHRYQMIESVLQTLSDDDDPESLYNEEPPCYTSELTEWLNSANNRVYYLTQALEEYGDVRDGFQLLALAWQSEFREVGDSIVAFLQSKIEDDSE